MPEGLRGLSAPLFAPLLLPYHVSRAADTLLSKEDEDARVIESVGAIVTAFTESQLPGAAQPAFSLPGGGGTSGGTSGQSPSLFSNLLSSLPPPSLQGLSDLSSNVVKAGPIGLLIGRKVGRSLLLRAAERLDRTSTRLGPNDDDEGLALRTASAASSLSRNLASRLAGPDERAKLE